MDELSREQVEAIRNGLLSSDWCGFSKRKTVHALCDMALAYLDAKADAGELPKNGEIVGKNPRDSLGRWKGSVWLEPGDVLIRVNRPELAKPKDGQAMLDQARGAGNE